MAEEPRALAARADSSAAPAPDDAREVARLLAVRCARCHGAGSEDRKALRDWDQAHDLAATVAEGLLVVAGEPLDSDLFLVCDDGDMPPEDEPEEALSADELALLERWIAAGAPLPQPEPEVQPGVQQEDPLEATTEPSESDDGLLGPDGAPAQGTPPAAAADEGDEVPAPPAPRHRGARSWLSFAGRWHVLVLHFPVVLLVLASAGALRRGGPGPMTRLHLSLAAPASVVAAGTGWLLGRDAVGDFELHRWLGVATAALSLVTLLAVRQAAALDGSVRPSPTGKSAGAPTRLARAWRLLLLVTLFVMLAAAHGGGELVHGEDWLRLPLDS